MHFKYIVTIELTKHWLVIHSFVSSTKYFGTTIKAFYTKYLKDLFDTRIQYMYVTIYIEHVISIEHQLHHMSLYML